MTIATTRRSSPDPQTGQGVGIARYIRSEQDPTVAELAIAVVDDWQGMGGGGRLAAALADRARDEGITAFTGLVLADNELMLNLAKDLGTVRFLHRGQGSVERRIELPQEKSRAQLSRLLRAVRTGQLKPFPMRRRPE